VATHHGVQSLSHNRSDSCARGRLSLHIIRHHHGPGMDGLVTVRSYGLTDGRTDRITIAIGRLSLHLIPISYMYRVSMSPWSCSAVLDGQLYTHSRSHWPSTSAFYHSAEVGCTALSIEQFRSSTLFCGGPVDLEFAARQSS